MIENDEVRKILIEEESSVTISKTTEVVEETSPVNIVVNNYYNETKDTKEKAAAKEVTSTTENKKVDTVVVVGNFKGIKKPRPPFALKLRRGEDRIRDMYNEIKAEFLSYGLKSRVSLNCDSFRLHTKTYAIIQVVGKSLKINYALDCKDYVDSTIPFSDASKLKLYAETPFTFKVRSNLSIKRAKDLIKSAVLLDGVTQENEPIQKNYAREAIETLKNSKYYLNHFARK